MDNRKIFLSLRSQTWEKVAQVRACVAVLNGKHTGQHPGDPTEHRGERWKCKPAAHGEDPPRAGGSAALTPACDSRQRKLVASEDPTVCE